MAPRQFGVGGGPARVYDPGDGAGKTRPYNPRRIYFSKTISLSHYNSS
jgi:hypothetical protein